MTVIAYKNSVMAADTSSWSGNVTYGKARKIVRLNDGSLLGAAGWFPEILKLRLWAKNGFPENKIPEKAGDGDLSGLLVKPDRSIWHIDYLFRLSLDSDWDIGAVGSNTEFLFGAMLAGAEADEAIALAIKHCNFAAGEVDVWRLEGGG